jgi:hypothetical protein
MSHFGRVGTGSGSLAHRIEFDDHATGRGRVRFGTRPVEELREQLSEALGKRKT